MKVNMKIYIINITIILLSIGCNPTSEKISDHCMHVAIDWDSNVVPKLSEYISRIDYIPLETSSDNLIGEIKKIIKKGNRFYILTNQNEIMCFENSGKYCNKINRIGRGPDEYTEITDFDISNSEKVYIWDNVLRKFFVYTISGEILKKRKIDVLFTNFRLVTESKIIAYCNTYSKYQIAFIDLEKLDIKHFLPFNEKKPKFNLRYKLVDRSDNFAFTLEDCDTIFYFRNNQIIPMMWIDFGKRKKKRRLGQDENFDVALLNSSDTYFANNITNYLDFKDIGYFKFQMSIVNINAFLNKKNKKVVYSASIFNDLSNIPFISPISNTDKSMISYINAYDFITIFSKNKKEEEIKKNKVLHEEYNKFSNLGLNSFSNPILIEYYLK